MRAVAPLIVYSRFGTLIRSLCSPGGAGPGAASCGVAGSGLRFRVVGGHRELQLAQLCHVDWEAAHARCVPSRVTDGSFSTALALAASVLQAARSYK